MDTGAIKFVLSGANIMCPGLTSPGATMHNEVCFPWPNSFTLALVRRDRLLCLQQVHAGGREL